MSMQTWTELYVGSTVSGTAIASSTTETIIFPDVTIFANYMYAGRKLKVYANGQYSTTGTPTLVFSSRWGGIAGVLLSKTGTITTGSGATANLFEMEYLLTCKTTGTAGTFEANGRVYLHGATAPTVGSATGAPAIGAMTVAGQLTPGTASVDTTIDKAFSQGAQWSANSASNTLTGRDLEIWSNN